MDRILIVLLSPIVLVWCLAEGLWRGWVEFRKDFMLNWRTGCGMRSYPVILPEEDASRCSD